MLSEKESILVNRPKLLLKYVLLAILKSKL